MNAFMQRIHQIVIVTSEGRIYTRRDAMGLYLLAMGIVLAYMAVRIVLLLKEIRDQGPNI